MAVLVKTVGGLAYANVKTYGGLAVASVKTINGVDATSGGGVTYLYQTDFPGSSPPAGGGTNGTVTVSGGVLTCAVDGSEWYYDNIIASQNEVWIYFQVTVNSSVGDPPRIYGLFDTGFSNVQLYVDLTGGVFNVYDSGGLKGSTVSTWTTGVTYNCWIHYKKVTVANDGVVSVAFSTSTTEPLTGSNNFAGSTSAVSTSAVRSTTLQAFFGATESVSFKKYRIANVAIGNNPS